MLKLDTIQKKCRNNHQHDCGHLRKEEAEEEEEEEEEEDLVSNDRNDSFWIHANTVTVTLSKHLLLSKSGTRKL